MYHVDGRMGILESLFLFLVQIPSVRMTHPSGRRIEGLSDMVPDYLLFVFCILVRVIRVSDLCDPLFF
jgi:hypothetical protein